MTMKIKDADGAQKPSYAPQCPVEMREVIAELLRIDEGGDSLRSFWLGRLDRLRTDELDTLRWMTVNLLPAEVASTFQEFSNGVVSFKGLDHHALSHGVMNAAASMLASEPHSAVDRHK